MFAKKIHKVPTRSKYEGKASFKCFNCEKIRHITSICLETLSKLRYYVRRTYKPNITRNRNRYNKDKQCYITDEEGVSDNEVDDSDNKEWVFVSIKEDQLAQTDPLVENAFVAKVNEKDE